MSLRSIKPDPDTSPTTRIHPRRDDRSLVDKDLQHTRVKERVDPQRFFLLGVLLGGSGIREERVWCCFGSVVDFAIYPGIGSSDSEGLGGWGPG